MAYQVIARKYRPQRFVDVVGQDHVATTLQNAIAQRRVAHAYLFCGPRGTGKTTLARIFAKCLNCTGGPKVDFADEDPRCLEIAEGRSLDVIEIDGASNNGVEQVRELRETCRYAPAVSPFKIYIIDEVHMLSTAAFNALLKTLEEPPAHVKFMFATTDPEKVLPTILSRCQRFDLRRIPTDLIVRHLAQIAVQEGVQISEPALFAIARGADGGMRDAESALDQLISFCGTTIEEPDVLAMFGVTGRDQLAKIFEAVLSQDAAAALGALDGLCRQGKDLGRLMADLLDHGRNLLVLLMSKGNSQLLQVSEAEAAALREQAARTSAPELLRVLDVLADSETRLRDASSRRLAMEVALLRSMEARRSMGIDDLLQRLAQLRTSDLSAAAQPSPPPAGPVAVNTVRSPAPVPDDAAASAANPSVGNRPTAGVPAATAPVPGDLASLWPALLEVVGHSSRFLQGYLSQAHPVSFDARALVIGFGPEHIDQLELVNHSRNRQTLERCLAALGHSGREIKFVRTEAEPANGGATPSSLETKPTPAPLAPVVAPLPAAAARPKPEPVVISEQDFKDDPRIRKALELFKGQIVQVNTQG